MTSVMKQNLMRPLLTVALAVQGLIWTVAMAVAQTGGGDTKIDVDLKTDAGGAGGWYTLWWVWVLVAVFVIVIVALTTRGRGRTD